MKGPSDFSHFHFEPGKSSCSVFKFFSANQISSASITSTLKTTDLINIRRWAINHKLIVCRVIGWQKQISLEWSITWIVILCNGSVVIKKTKTYNKIFSIKFFNEKFLNLWVIKMWVSFIHIGTDWAVPFEINHRSIVTFMLLVHFQAYRSPFCKIFVRWSRSFEISAHQLTDKSDELGRSIFPGLDIITCLLD